MIILSTKRILKFSWQHFWRNVWLSIVTITIIVLTLFSLTTLVLVNAIADSAVGSVRETVDVSLYFDNKMTGEAVELLKTQLEEIDEIAEIEYISPETALERFKADHVDDVDITASLAELEDNPLGATLILKAHNVDEYPIIMEKIEVMQAHELAEKIDYDDHRILISRINDFSGKIRTFSFALSLIFIVIALFTVFNTIRMGIYIHRKEIGIMRLVGASNWYIRMPFIIEGLLYAIFGCLVFWGLLFISLSFIAPWVNSFFSGINFIIQDYLISNVLFIFGFELILLSMINVISAIIAMGRYLRV
jgi:cell division transport system permease protein